MSTPCAPMWRHPLFALALMLIFALVTPASFAQNKTEDALKDWSSRPITILAGSHVGGIFDKMTWGFATHLSKELARLVIVQKISGTPIKAGNYLLRQPDDGYTFLISAPVPYMVLSIDNKDVNFDLSDFAIINNQWNSMSGPMLNNKHSHKDVRALFEDIRENPLKLSVGVLPRSASQVNLLLTLEAMDIPVKNLRIIYYPSGSQLRTAVAGGQVDFGIVTHEGYTSIQDFARALAVFQPETPVYAPDDLKPVINVPTVNQMLEDQGKSVIFLPSSLKSIIAPKGFQMKYPDRYKKIKKIFEKVAKSNAFIQDMKKRIVGVDWQGEKASTIERLNAYDLFVGYNDLLKKYE